MVSDSQQSFLRELITVRSREVIAGVLRHASSLPRHGRNEERLFVRDGFLPELDPQFETAVTRLQPSSHKTAAAISSQLVSLRRYRAESSEGSRQVRAPDMGELLACPTAQGGPREYPIQVFLRPSPH